MLSVKIAAVGALAGVMLTQRHNNRRGRGTREGRKGRHLVSGRGARRAVEQACRSPGRTSTRQKAALLCARHEPAMDWREFMNLKGD